MTGCPPDAATMQRFVADINATPPRLHHASLLALAQKRVPQCNFSFALTRGGWQRPGGLIRPDGSRVTHDLLDWAEAEFDHCGGNMEVFLERYRSEELIATCYVGKTHYFVAPFGTEPSSFLQLEVDELQEVLDRQFLNPQCPADDVQDLIEPVVLLSLAPHSVGRPHYRFRRLTDIRDALTQQPQPLEGQSPLTRFMSEWQKSRASSEGHYSNHWIVTLREHIDRYSNTQMIATPVSRHARQLKPFHWDLSLHGPILAQQIQAFDRAAGYPAAWYFHLVAGATTPYDLAFVLAEDVAAGFDYLAESDLSLLEGWLENPYSV